MPEELRQDDRRELDDAVLELLGATDPTVRQELLDQLYLETTLYYRYLRTQDIQSMENRAGGQRRKLSVEDVGATIWDSLDAGEQGPPLAEWLESRKEETEWVSIPDGKATALGLSHMFSPAGVDFMEGKAIHHKTYGGPQQAALVAVLANLDVRGRQRVPVAEDACKECRRAVDERLAKARSRFAELAESRSGNQGFQDGVTSLLMQWFVHGRTGR